MKILTAHQPAYLPWCGLMHKIAIADVYVYMDDVKYSKSDKFINRNYIKNPNGKQLLTLPLKTGGSDNFLVKDLEIDDPRKHLKAHFNNIRQNYIKSAFFKMYETQIKEIYDRPYLYLKDISYDLLVFIAQALGIQTQFVKATNLEIGTSKNQYLIDLCKKFNCNMYIFGAQGRDYADAEIWSENNISIEFQDYKHPEYKQMFGGFEPYLSVLDLLFNHGPESLFILTNDNLKKEDLI